MEANKCRRKILMFPWLAFGHISPYLELAKKLSQHNFQIFLCSSPVNLQSIQSKLSQNCCSNNSIIQLIELNLPSLPELPPHMHTTNGLPLHLNSALHNAFAMAAPEFHSILQKLSPHLLITEMFQPWAIQSASSLDIPIIPFLVAGAGAFSLVFHSLVNPGVEFPFSELDLCLISGTFENVPERLSLVGSVNQVAQWMQRSEVCSDVVLVKSFREIEDKYIDYLSVLMKKKVIPVGPLVREVDEKSDWTLEWLDKKEPRSTVYVSFGSEYYLSKRDMEELSMGLEMSGANFIWVVRFSKGEETGINEALPYGLMERVGERGIVVDGWAPQRKILNHLSVGGFVSHCGWSSLVEAVVSGVPIIALPMQLDQPINMKVAMAAGVAIEAPRGFDGAMEKEGVANAIKQLLFEKIGENVNKKVKEICKILKVKESQNIEVCVAEINKIWESRRVC